MSEPAAAATPPPAPGSTPTTTTPAPAPIPTKKPRPRWMLHLQAEIWRKLMGIGMLLHRLAPPRPPKSNFTRKIPTSVAKVKGHVVLHFYVPKDWHNQLRLRERHYPIVVNFHGGGFTLGSATDDARWAKTVVEEVDAVVVSVDYRRAPEHPFPIAVEDGVDAFMYLAEHAQELNLDLDKIAVSGFSSGANMAFTVPLRLQEELETELAKTEINRHLSVIEGRRPGIQKAFSEGRILVKARREISVKAVVAWYPSLDYTHTREQRRATCARLDQQLPAVFTDLFDESYLQPPTMDMANPYLSPGVAPDHMLAGLPQEIILFTCEWDMLLREGEAFRDTLERLNKTVHYTMVPEAPHGWDKAPNPLRQTPGVQTQYLKACKELQRLLNAVDTEDES